MAGMKKIGQKMYPMNHVIKRFMEQTLSQLETNVITQHVFPTEIYSGFSIVNQKRKEGGMWYSTGRGARSFRARLVNATKDGDITLVFSFNDYMRFVDMGVGGKTDKSKVDSGKKANYKNRYVSVWDRSKGKSQRPAIMMEMRHLERRIRDYVSDYYGKEAELQILEAFSELPEIKIM